MNCPICNEDGKVISGGCGSCSDGKVKQGTELVMQEVRRLKYQLSQAKETAARYQRAMQHESSKKVEAETKLRDLQNVVKLFQNALVKVGM